MPLSRFLLSAVTSALLASCAIPMVAPAHSAPAAPTTIASGYRGTEAHIFDLINAERRRQGLRPLVFNERLDRMAKLPAPNRARFRYAKGRAVDARIVLAPACS